MEQLEDSGTSIRTKRKAGVGLMIIGLLLVAGMGWIGFEDAKTAVIAPLKLNAQVAIFDGGMLRMPFLVISGLLLFAWSFAVLVSTFVPVTKTTEARWGKWTFGSMTVLIIAMLVTGFIGKAYLESKLQAQGFEQCHRLTNFSPGVVTRYYAKDPSLCSSKEAVKALAAQALARSDL